MKALWIMTVFLVSAMFPLSGLGGSMSYQEPDGLPEDATTFLEQEAGISAYGQLSAVNLDDAGSAFKTVEAQTAQYIIGSVALDDYGEADDVHVYLDTSGWIIGYYLKEEKASKIMDWKSYTGKEIKETKLEDALSKVCNAMYAYLPTLYYYDFRYPDAKSLMIVTDEEDGNDEWEYFRIKFPSSHVLYSITWSHAIEEKNVYSLGGKIKIDDTVLHSSGIVHGWSIWEGDISPMQFTPDVFHRVGVYNDEGGNYKGMNYVAIVLVYTQQ